MQAGTAGLLSTISTSRFASGTRSPAYSMIRVPFGIIFFANTPVPSISDCPTLTKSLFVGFMAILICPAMVVTFVCSSAVEAHGRVQDLIAS